MCTFEHHLLLLSIGGIYLYPSYCLFLDSLRLLELPAGITAGVLNFLYGNTYFALHVVEDVGAWGWSGYEQRGHVSLTIRGRESEGWNSLDNHLILIQLHF